MTIKKPGEQTTPQDENVAPDGRPEDQPEDRAGGAAPAGGDTGAAPETVEDEAPPPKPKPGQSPADAAREAIAAGIRARRAAESAGGAGPFGAEVAVQRREGEEPVEEPQKPADKAPEQQQDGGAQGDKPKTYKIKAHDNEIEVDRAELLKLAGIDADDPDAGDYKDAHLIRWAGRELASQDNLRQTSEAKKRAKAAAAADPDQGQGGRGQDDGPSQPPADQPDPYEKAAETIQYEDPKEAAKALRKLVADAVADSSNFEKTRTAVEAIEQSVEVATRTFEETHGAELGILDNEDRAWTFYNRSVVREVKKDLVAAGFPQANVDNLITDIVKASDAYTVARAQGHKLRDPGVLYQAARGAFRETLGMGPATDAPPPRQAVDDRRAAKRDLPASPTRSSPSRGGEAAPAPQSSATSVIERMAAARGQRTVPRAT